MTVQLATITLPEDMQWSDEFNWLPTAQQVEIASNGALIIEESAQLQVDRSRLSVAMAVLASLGLIARSWLPAMRSQQHRTSIR
jgi:hypothetical protein